MNGPEFINKHSEHGHWEADTVIGKNKKHCILTPVERKEGFIIIKKLMSGTVEHVNKALAQTLTEHGEKIKTITFDNGTEFHGYKAIEEQFPVISYFVTPYHSWERVSNENTNGLIRQYIPKSACMKNITQAYCDKIAHALNTRPRKRYCYKTPYELYYDQEPSLHFTLEAECLFFNLAYKPCLKLLV